MTLGGTGKEVGKRHPTLKDNVMVSAGAKVLGSITLGEDVRVGAGAVVLKDVPDNCTVVGIPGRIVIKDGKKIKTTGIDLDHGNLPDPVQEMLKCMNKRIRRLEKENNKLEREWEDGGKDNIILYQERKKSLSP